MTASHPLWLPSAGVTFGNVAELPAGSLVFRPADYRAAKIDIGVRVDHTREDGAQVRLIFCLTPWYEDHLPPGDLFEVDAAMRAPGFASTGQRRLVLEVDFAAPSAESEAPAGKAAMTEDGLRLLGYFGRNIDPHNRGPMPINPETWNTGYPRHRRGEFAFFDRWRLRLRLSERDSVFFGPGAQG